MTIFHTCECGATTWFNVPRQAFTSISVPDFRPPAFEDMPLLRRLTALDQLETDRRYAQPRKEARV